ncbi:MAG: transposase [Patescibacteria group bacterium]|nr:transposase [Patescibacteria group bacterium]
MRRIKISPGECYHLYNRGNNKQNIFRDNRDRARLLFLLIGLQSELSFKNISRLVSALTKRPKLILNARVVSEVSAARYVDLISFVLMPNHFHLIVFERKEGGIAKYMQRALNAYTKYFNTRYKKMGMYLGGHTKPFISKTMISFFMLLPISTEMLTNYQFGLVARRSILGQVIVITSEIIGGGSF